MTPSCGPFPRVTTSLVAAVFPLALAMQPCLASPPPAGDSGTHVLTAKGGLTLLLRIQKDSAKLLRFTAMKQPPPGHDLRPPQLSLDSLARAAEGGAGELVLALFASNGRLLAAYGWPGEAIAFHDEGDLAGEETLAGGPTTPAVDDRILSVPVPEVASFLALFRTEIVGYSQAPPPLTLGPDSCVVVDPHGRRLASIGDAGPLLLVPSLLAIYDLRTPAAPGSPPLPVPDWFQPPAAGIPRFKVTSSCVGTLVSAQARASSLCPAPDGAFVDTTILAGSGAADTRFDVVILGDGFQTPSEMADFDAWADKVKSGILGAEPFLSLASKIVVYKVRTTSTDSGVGSCPASAPVTRRTYYGIKGGCKDLDGDVAGPAFFCAPSPCTVMDTVETIAPVSQIELIVMVANCSLYGGSSWPDIKMAFVPSYAGHFTNSKPKFEPLVLHESGHGIAALGEEYMACAKVNRSRTHANIFDANGSSTQAPWISLSTASETDSAGNFKAVHNCGDPVTLRCEPSVSAPGNAKMLGLYWGAMYGDPKISPPCGSPCGTASCDYYRPTSHCRMRKLIDPYCRVCEDTLKKAINTAAP